MKAPRVILGTMTIGGPKGQTSQIDATAMLKSFCNPKWTDSLIGKDPMVDTAIMYQGGETEKALGKILKNNIQSNDSLFPSTLSIATKANAFTKDKNLSPFSLRTQLEESLKSLGKNKVDIFYLHAPDLDHDIEPTLEEVQKLFLEDKFNRFALSNFKAWETVYIHSYMSQRGYIAPSIYQGMYNAVTRQVEEELFPALRKCSMSFYAYNPLAGGMLSGKYFYYDNDEITVKENSKFGGRFSGTSFWAKKYRERYQQKQQFEAIEVVKKALQKEEKLADVSLRWLRYHSKLNENDGIIVGASKLTQLDDNIESLASDLLPDRLVKAFDEASRLCKDICPKYARGYSGSSLV